jgi:hypothetical protein
MIKNLRWQPNERLYFLGRNGIGRCTGIQVFHCNGPHFLDHGVR